VFADWLEDNGRPQRAEFIRVQVELARLPPFEPARAGLERRQEELLAAHAAEWMRHLPAWARGSCEFRRGFAAVVRADEETFLNGAEELSRLTPLEGLRAVRPGAGTLPRLLALPQTSNFTTLEVKNPWLGPALGRALAGAPGWPTLPSSAWCGADSAPRGRWPWRAPRTWPTCAPSC
jgi:hypothetical protein